MNSDFVVKVRKALRKPLPFSDFEVEEITRARVMLVKDIEETIKRNSGIGKSQLVNTYQEVFTEVEIAEAKFWYEVEKAKEEGLKDKEYWALRESIGTIEDALDFIKELAKIYFPDLHLKEYEPKPVSEKKKPGWRRRGFNSFEEWKSANFEEYEKAEKIFHSFQEWNEGKLPWSMWSFAYGETGVWHSNESISKVHVLPEAEFQKIVGKQNQILANHIQVNLDWYIKTMEEKLVKSLEPELLVVNEIALLNEVLTNKNFTRFSYHFNSGKCVTRCDTYLPASAVNEYKNGIAYWHNLINVQAQYEPRIFINPSDEDNYSRYIPQVATLVLFRYREYLKSRKLIQNQGILDKETKDFIKEMVAEDEIEKAIQKLKEHTKNSNFYDRVVEISGKFQSLIKDDSNGTISAEERDIRRNRIRVNIQELLIEL